MTPTLQSRLLSFLRRADRLVATCDMVSLFGHTVRNAKGAVPAALCKLSAKGLVRRGRWGKRPCWCAVPK